MITRIKGGRVIYERTIKNAYVYFVDNKIIDVTTKLFKSYEKLTTSRSLE